MADRRANRRTGDADGPRAGRGAGPGTSMDLAGRGPPSQADRRSLQQDRRVVGGEQLRRRPHERAGGRILGRTVALRLLPRQPEEARHRLELLGRLGPAADAQVERAQRERRAPGLAAGRDGPRADRQDHDRPGRRAAAERGIVRQQPRLARQDAGHGVGLRVEPEQHVLREPHQPRAGQPVLPRAVAHPRDGSRAVPDRQLHLRRAQPVVVLVRADPGKRAARRGHRADALPRVR